MESGKKTPHYAEEFRRQVVLEYMAGGTNINQLGVKYGIKGGGVIKHWIECYRKHGVCTMHLKSRPKEPKAGKAIRKPGKDPKRMEDALRRIKDLERQLEDERLLKEMYSRMIDIAEKEDNISIRKKGGAR